ncbi:MAG: hypothetical protein HPY50_10575 [Firmicutes bacterium]|nr:hypothetical protein [Bacillota bacterium]
MTDLQVKFLVLGIGLIFVKVSLLVTVLIIAKKIQRRAKALKEKQQANQAAMHFNIAPSTGLKEQMEKMKKPGKDIKPTGGE